MDIAIIFTVSVITIFFIFRHYPLGNRRTAIEVCQALLRITCDMQRHRGLSIALIDGEDGLIDEHNRTEQALSQTIYGISENYAEDHSVLRNGHWDDLINHWRSLSKNWRSLDFVNLLYAHNDIVIECINILRTVAKKQSRLLGEKRVNILLEWPLLIENLGMLRALGMHVISTKPETNNNSEQVALLMMNHRQNALHSLKLLSDDELTDPNIKKITENFLIRIASFCDGNHSFDNAKIYYDEITPIMDRWYGILNSHIMLDESREGFFLPYNET